MVFFLLQKMSICCRSFSKSTSPSGFRFPFSSFISVDVQSIVIFARLLSVIQTTCPASFSLRSVAISCRWRHALSLSTSPFAVWSWCEIPGILRKHFWLNTFSFWAVSEVKSHVSLGQMVTDTAMALYSWILVLLFNAFNLYIGCIPWKAAVALLILELTSYFDIFIAGYNAP